MMMFQLNENTSNSVGTKTILTQLLLFHETEFHNLRFYTYDNFFFIVQFIQLAATQG